MAATQPESDGDELGPVDFLAIEFPGGRLTAPGFEKLLGLADQRIVDILDMEFIANASAVRGSGPAGLRRARPAAGTSRPAASRHE